MARPRQPATILQLRGSHKAHPERVRADAEGAAPFCREAPDHLSMPVRRAWDYVVARLPRITLSSSDEVVVEQAARVLAAIWETEQRVGPLAGSDARVQAVE